MDFLIKNCKELNYKSLLAVNGGCSGSCSGGYSSSSGSMGHSYSYEQYSSCGRSNPYTDTNNTGASTGAEEWKIPPYTVPSKVIIERVCNGVSKEVHFLVP